jgi:hypothetical protein
MIVEDPDGLIIRKELNEISGAFYIEADLNNDGSLDDSVIITESKIGDYLITILPELEAVLTDTYSFEVSVDDVVITLASNTRVSNIPKLPYLIRATGSEIIPIIPATIDFVPNTLDLKSEGRWVTVYIELPVGHGYDVSEISATSIMLYGLVQPEAKLIEIGDYDGDGIPDLMAKFNRKAVQSILSVGDEAGIIITGRLIDGRLFEGTDTIRVIPKK